MRDACQDEKQVEFSSFALAQSRPDANLGGHMLESVEHTKRGTHGGIGNCGIIQLAAQ